MRTQRRVPPTKWACGTGVPISCQSRSQGKSKSGPGAPRTLALGTQHPGCETAQGSRQTCPGAWDSNLATGFPENLRPGDSETLGSPSVKAESPAGPLVLRPSCRHPHHCFGEGRGCVA